MKINKKDGVLIKHSVGFASNNPQEEGSRDE